MKRVTANSIALLAVAGLLALMTGIAAAATSSSMPSSKDLGKLNAEISMLNSYKGLPEGDKVISKQLSDSFNVSSGKIDSMLSRTPQIGDAAATLAFADKMPGGVTDSNISKVEDMKSRGGWAQVASNLNVDLGKVAKKLNSLENDTHKNIKEALAESFSSERAAGGVGQYPGETGEGMPGGATGGTGTESGAGGMSGETGTDSGMGGMGGGMSGGTGTDSGMGGGTDSGTSNGSTAGPYGY